MRQAHGYFMVLIPLVADGSGAPTYWRFGSPNVNSSPAGEPRLEIDAPLNGVRRPNRVRAGCAFRIGAHIPCQEKQRSGGDGLSG